MELPSVGYVWTEKDHFRFACMLQVLPPSSIAAASGTAQHDNTVPMTAMISSVQRSMLHMSCSLCHLDTLLQYLLPHAAAAQRPDCAKLKQAET